MLTKLKTKLFRWFSCKKGRHRIVNAFDIQEPYYYHWHMCFYCGKVIRYEYCINRTKLDILEVVQMFKKGE